MSRIENPILKDGGGYTHQGVPPALAKTQDNFQDFTGAMPANVGGVVPGDKNKSTQAVLYPAKFMRKVPEEDELNTLTTAINQFAIGDDAPFTKPELPQMTVDLVQKKQRQAFERALHAWIEENYDIENPVNVAYVLQLWPEYFEKKKETINEAIDYIKKISYLNLMSGYIAPGDEETKQFVIALAFGMIDVDRSIMKYILPEAADWEGDEGRLVERGLFSPVTYPTHGRGQLKGGLINLLKGDTRTKVLNMNQKTSSSIWGSGPNAFQQNARNPGYATLGPDPSGDIKKHFWGNARR